MHLPNLKISWRAHQRQPLFTIVNILGLAVALSVVILIATYVRHEMSYDTHWADSERIYRVTGTWITETGEEITFPTSVGGLAPTLEREVPGVESCLRIIDWSFLTPLSTDNAASLECIPMVDTTLFDIFNIKLIAGDPKEAINRNMTVIIDEFTARKFFGDENPIGKHLDTESDTFYTVAGVFEDITGPTHLRKYRMFSVIPRNWIDSDWGLEIVNTYIKLGEGVDPKSLQAALDSLTQQHISEFTRKKGKDLRLNLQPIRDIHLYSTLSNKFSCCEENTTPAIENIRLFTGIGLLVLIIACLNYVNLSTARSAGRGKQVGIAKVAGATRSRLFRSFLLESIIVTAVSLAVALLIATLCLSRFVTLIGADSNIVGHVDLASVMILIAFTIVVGTLAGFYPAVFLSGFHPAQVLKGTLNLGMKGMKLRAALVIIQFTISAALITGMLIVRGQIKYIFSKPLGYNIENLVMFSEMGYEDDWNREAFINQLKALPGVKELALSNHLPLMPGIGSAGLGKCFKPGSTDEIINLNSLSVGTSFPQVLRMNLLAGRWFDTETNSDYGKSLIINQSMAKLLGFDDPVGRTIKDPYRDSTRTRTIIGLVQDFHWKSLHSSIEPVYLRTDSKRFRYLLIRYDPLNLPEILAGAQEIWNNSVPDVPFNYRFMEDIYRQLHLSDTRFQTLFIGLTLLAIFIACLGLFALVAYAVERRTREIGIRKALGASATGIILLLSREFVILVLISNLVAAPLSYYLMRQWLEGYAYHITIEPYFFLMAACLSLLIALVTVVIQAYRTAMMNPVDSLRTE